MLPVLLLVAALLPLAGTAEAAPDSARYCRVNDRANIDLFLDHAEVRSRLQQIERDSGGNVEVEVAGQSFQGRDIFSARVGHGDEVLLVQSEIHGNEKHGTVALLDVVERLGANTERAAEIREQITLVAIPMLNVDGGELNRRQNDMSWAQTQATYPQLAEVDPPWYYNANVGGYDLNRDFHVDLDYEPRPEDFPVPDNDFGRYLAPESRMVRDLYAQLEDEFGTVDVFIDLHNQGPCNRFGTPEEVESRHLTYLSLTATLIDESRWEPLYPALDFDASRRANLAIFDALQTGGLHALARVSLYPQHFDDPGTALGAFAMRGSAVVLFETSGQTQHIGHQRINLLVRQIDIGLMGLVDAMADDTLDDLDPERYDDIPARSSWTAGS